RLLVALNGEPDRELTIELPPGTWTMIVNGENVDLTGLGTTENELTVPATSGIVLIKSAE
ncbi:MAG: hypothetical protein GXO90_06075, partial [FCB group bacterium]|nr:hypothetical protein [FCB group bacterium]